MLHWAHRLLGDRERARDAVQDALVVSLLRAKDVVEESERAWLLGVTTRVCRGLKRRWGLRQASLSPEDASRSTCGDGERDVLQRERGARVERCLERLSERQREVVELVFGAGLSVEQASRVLRVSVGTARTHYHRAKEALGAMLREEGFEDEGG
jgi:RNA polymerase sigma-70 factor (ECF subfamily)